jgi:hypothetical protein
MDVEEIQFEIVLPRDESRSEGLHLSDVIRDMAFNLNVLDRKYDTEDMDKVLVLLGIAWENEITKQHPEILFHPGEFKRDGVVGTPDGICVVDGDISLTGCDPVSCRVHEFKYTRKSSRNFLQHLIDNSGKVWMYLVQIKSYCKLLDSTEAWLHVLFANGDYSPNASPEYRIYRLSFTQAEIDANWKMVSGHYKYMLKGRVDNGSKHGRADARVRAALTTKVR